MKLVQGALVALSFGCAAAAAAQSYTVKYGDLTSYTSPSNPTGISFNTDDELSSAIALPNSGITYFGTTYTEVEVGTDGFIVMGKGNSYPGSKPDHTAGSGLVIAPRWNDLNPTAGGKVLYETVGDVLVIEWLDVPLKSTPPVVQEVTMQIRLDTKTNEIEFHYGKPGNPPSGTTDKEAVAISSAAGAGQEVIYGDYVDSSSNVIVDKSNGTMKGWPSTAFILFQPNSGSVNQPPTISGSYQVSPGGPTTLITNGMNIAVAYGRTLASLSLSFQVNDPDTGATVSVSTTVSNLGSTGILASEFSKTSSAAPYNLTPITGRFNTPNGTTHLVTMTASDGTANTVFSFSFVQSAATQGVLAVSDTAGSIAYGAAAGSGPRNFGSRDIASGATATITITVNNRGPGTMSLGTPTMAGTNPGEFVLGTGSFATTLTAGNSTTFTVAFDPSTVGSKVANVQFTHTDLCATSPFSFEVTGTGTSTTPVPIAEVHETSVAGLVISNGAAAAGVRAFGSHDLTALPSAPITIVVRNAGTADLTVQLPSSSSADFTIGAAGFPANVTPGSTVSFTITFAATTVGIKSGTISFAHNDTSTATPFTFAVSGTATTTGGGGGGGTTPISGGGGGGGCAAGASGAL
ncbi:MAG: choice-of-anchor D domain-containing protein, partial [Planctomycetes bacterium]|nr:choice-of-anchor D domain-containing protein [Planctomycetota bacterium]